MKVNGNLNRILSMLERAREESNKSNRLKPIEDNRFIYALSVGESCICFDCRLNESDTNRVMKKSSVDKDHKKEEERKIIEKSITNYDFIVVNNSKNEYPVILLNDDISETKVSYMLIKKEDNKRINGVIISPIFYDKEQNELIILGNSLEIEKSEVFLEQKICVGRKLLMLKDGRKFIANVTTH
jgi:hypothetical protein